MITKNNKKVGCSTFNIPPGKEVCKGICTPLCAEFCYGNQGYLSAPSIQNSWNSNFAATKEDNFVQDLINNIRENSINEYFRWLSFGELYDIDFLKNVQEVICNTSNKHLIFTKSWIKYHPTRFKEFYQDNSEIIMSMFPDSKFNMMNDFQRYYYSPRIGFAGEPWYYPVEWQERIAGAFHCPGYCPDCRYCWNGKGDVRITIHPPHFKKRIEKILNERGIYNGNDNS